MSIKEIVSKIRDFLSEVEAEPDTPEADVIEDMAEDMLEVAENIADAPKEVEGYDEEKVAKILGYEDAESMRIDDEIADEDSKAAYDNILEMIPKVSAAYVDEKPPHEYTYNERLAIYKADKHLYKSLFRN